MATAYSPEAWTDLFVASAGASAALALVIGGASILAGAGGGLYWIVGALAGASINAWVLLVEILR